MSDLRTIETGVPRDLSLDEEIQTLTDDDVPDMANLIERQTGIEGVVYISTNFPKLPHGPRVKYFQKAGKGQSSFSVSISDQPHVLASSLPDRVLNRMAPKVIEWVRINREALLSFWREGDAWSEPDVSAMIAALKRLD